MNEEMLRWLDAKEHEAKVRRISGDMCVEASKAGAIVTRICERFGRLGFDVKVHRRYVDEESGKVWVCIDFWCDATADVLEELALHGFHKMIDVAGKSEYSDADDPVSHRIWDLVEAQRELSDAIADGAMYAYLSSDAANKAIKAAVEKRHAAGEKLMEALEDRDSWPDPKLGQR
jgi:hypothetical protein